MRHSGVLAVGVLVVTLLGCGSDSDDGDAVATEPEAAATGELTERDDPDSPRPVPIAIRYFRDLNGDSGGGDGSGPPAMSVEDLFEWSDTVVVASLVSVDRGLAVHQGPAEDGQPNEGQEVVDWGAENVDFRSIHVELVAEEVLKGDVAVGDPVPAYFIVYPDVDPGLIADALRELGDRVVVFLQPYQWPLEPDRGRIGQWAPIGPGDSVSLPFWPDTASPTVWQSMETLDQVRAAASG